MQVLKKIALFFLCLGLFGCNSPLTDNRIELSDQRYDIIDYDAINKSMVAENPLNVAVLLTLTGKASNVGLGMQNAMFKWGVCGGRPSSTGRCKSHPRTVNG